MTQKQYTLSLNKSVTETAKRLKGDISLSKYVDNALKAQNLRIAAKLRFEAEHRTQMESEVKELEQHPERIEQIVRMGAV